MIISGYVIIIDAQQGRDTFVLAVVNKLCVISVVIDVTLQRRFRRFSEISSKKSFILQQVYHNFRMRCKKKQNT